MVAVTENKTSYRKALLIASGPAMLAKMVRPLKESGMAVNACENFIDAKAFFNHQALVVLPLTEDDQQDAKAFVDWLRRQGKKVPYILGVGRCDAGQRKGLVAKMGLNDLITLPFDETVVQERLASFRRWCQLEEGNDSPSNNSPAPESAPLPLDGMSQPKETVIPPELLQTTRVSLFADSGDGSDEESPEAIFCRETPVGIAMFDRELRYVLANPRWVQQFRLQNEEIIGRSQFDVFPKLHPTWRKIYQRCLGGETRRGRETLDSGHGPLEMRWEVRPWRYLAGQIGGVTIAFEEVWRPSSDDDHSPQNAAETTTPTSVDSADGLRLDQLDGPALMVDLDGNVLETNPAAEMLGLATPEPDFLQNLRGGVDRLPLTELVRHRHPTSGETGHVAWTNSVLRDSRGEPSALLRVGVFLSEKALPKGDPAPARDHSRPAPAFQALKLLRQQQQEQQPPAPEIRSLAEDDLNELPELIWKANARGEITFFNKAWLNYRGRPLVLELNGGWLDGLHPEDARATKAVVAEAIRKQTPLEHSFRLRCQEGPFLEMEMWVRPFHDSEGSLVGFYGACRPHGRQPVPLSPPEENQAPTPPAAEHAHPAHAAATANPWPALEKEASEALAKLAEAEREILDLKEALFQAENDSQNASNPATTPDFAAAPIMLWCADRDGELTALNPAWERFRGRPALEELGASWLDGIPSERERENVAERLRHAAAQGQPFHCQFHFRDADETPRLVEMQGTPPGRGPASSSESALYGTLQDVTATHEALRRLRDLVFPERRRDGRVLVSELVEELGDHLPSWCHRQSETERHLDTFREVFDHVATGIVLLDGQGQSLFSNRRHRELLGFGIEEADDIEGWLRRGCNDDEHAAAVLKIWQEDIWRRQLTKIIALKTSKGILRELKFEPQLFLDDHRLLLTVHDVTESKRAEDAMRESEIRFRALFRESSMGIALIDAEERIYDINPSLERLLGIPRRQLLCRHFDECVFPADLPRKQALLTELMQSPKRSAHIELRLAKSKEENAPDEDDTWVRLHVSLVRDVDQRVLFTAYFVQDITEQKRVQGELLISQEQNRALLEVIPDLILLVDTEGQVIDLMPGESVPLQIDEENAIGRKIGDVIPDFAGRFAELIAEAYRLDDVVHFRFHGSEGQSLEARVVSCKPDNAVVTIHRDPAQTPTPAPSATPSTGPSTSENLPLRRQALTFHGSPQAIILTDLSGAIQDWNPAAQALFGYSPDEANGQPMPALFGVDSVDALTRHLQQGEGSRWAGELSFRRKDGADGRGKVVFLPLKSENGDLRAQAVFIRPADAPAPEPRQPEAPAENKLPLVHQRLRNNLQIISTLLNLQCKAQKEETARTALRASHNRTQALLILHEHIHVDGDQETVSFGPFAEALGNHLLRSYDAENRVELRTDIDQQLNLQAASPLALILNELLSNAIQHGFPGNASGKVNTSLIIEGEQGTLSVQDNGLGMPEQPSQLSGMGLPIVKTLASQIHGNLEKIDSTETEFRVYFRSSLHE